MKTEAWATLKPGPRSLLIELYALYNSLNNGELFLSELEAARRCNVTKQTARGYFGELRNRGFIKLNKKGGFNVKNRLASTWILTEFQYNGELPTKDFMYWSEKTRV